jgi:hypothetical protein
MQATACTALMILHRRRGIAGIWAEGDAGLGMASPMAVVISDRWSSNNANLKYDDMYQ